MKKIVIDRSKNFAIDLYYYVGCIKKRVETVYQLLQFRGYPYSYKTISFKILAPNVDKYELNHEEYIREMRRVNNLTHFRY